MIIALIAVLIAYKEHRFARNMAEVEGKFKKPEISISYENRKIEDVIWSFPIPREATIDTPWEVTRISRQSGMGRKIIREDHDDRANIFWYPNFSYVM